MKKLFFIFTLGCALCLGACASSGGTSDTAKTSAAAQAVSDTERAADMINLDDNDVAAFDECTARIDDVRLHADGKLSVDFTFTNRGSSDMYMYEAFSVSATEGGNTLRDVTDINNGTKREKAVLTKVKDGESVLCTYTFEGASKGEIMIDVCEPTADQMLLIEHIYRLDTFSD